MHRRLVLELEVGFEMDALLLYNKVVSQNHIEILKTGSSGKI